MPTTPQIIAVIKAMNCLHHRTTGRQKAWINHIGSAYGHLKLAREEREAVTWLNRNDDKDYVDPERVRRNTVQFLASKPRTK